MINCSDPLQRRSQSSSDIVCEDTAGQLYKPQKTMISNDHGCLEETLESGRLHLERLSFAEAEAAFGHVLDRLTSSSHPHGDRLRMTSLVGLAEIGARRCGDVTDDVDKWLSGNMSVLALYKEAAEIADRKRKLSGTGNSNRTIDNDVRYFEEVLAKSSAQAEFLEKELVEVVKQEVRSRAKRSGEKPDFDSEWIQKLVERCCCSPGLRHEDNEAATDNHRDNERRQQTTTTETTDRDNRDNGRQQTITTKTTDQDNRDNQRRQLTITTETTEPDNGRRQQTRTTDQDNRDNGRQQTKKKKTIETTDRDNQDNRNEEYTSISTTTIEDKTTLESRISEVPVLKRRIDYGRLQDGIRSIVGGVSGEVRSQYRHFLRRVPGQAMQRRLLNELVLRLSPGYRENEDLASLLEEAVQYDDCSAVMASDDLESRRNVSEEIILRIASKNWKEEEEEEEMESEEWGECWEKEEKVLRDDEDKEKEEEDEGDDDVETTELRLLSSAVHSTRAVGMEERYLGVASDAGSAALDVSRRSLLGSFTTSEAGNVALRNVRSKTRTPDFKTGNSSGSRGGGVVGPSGRVLTLWRSTGSNRVKVEPTTCPRNGPKEPNGGFEEISPLTDRDKVLGWLQSAQPEPHSNSSTRDRMSSPTTTHPSGDRVGQVLGHVILRAGDSFRKEKAYLEAHEMYKSAMGLFQRFPLPQGQQSRFAADLLLRMGAVKCSMGKVEMGSRMMEASVDLLVEGDALKAAELWFQVGNAYLAERMRRESLQARVMQLIREELEGDEEEGQGRGVEDDESSECDSDSDSECHSYCVCIYEALNAYRKALSALDSILVGNRVVPELVIGIASNMADCYVMTGNLDRAEVGYERALRLFPGTQSLLSLNAHVLSMLGTVCFLAGNRVRAATAYETASILLQNRDKDSEATLETAWTATMTGLSHSVLLHPDRAGVWCVRAFAAYTRFFRGQILDVDPLNRWFIVRTLYVLGTSIGANDKALYYLNLARNMTCLDSAGDDGDLRHLVKVLMAIADVYVALNLPEKARAYYEEALEYGKGIGEYGKKYGEDDLDDLQNTDDVKDDPVAALTCDLDKAIGYYSDIVDAFGDTADARHDVAGVMASLGTLCHVKDCMRDDDANSDESFLNMAERYFEEAFRMTGSSSPVCIRYANFLYRRGRYADALTVMLPYVFCSQPADDEVCYSGIEQVVLPDHLQHHITEEEDTLVLEARVFASFLATLCYNYLGLNGDADDALVRLYRLVVPSARPLDHVMLGYGLMERGLFEEAAGSFAVAAGLQPTPGCSRSTFNKARFCFLLFAYLTVARAVDFLLEFIYQRSVKHEQRNYLSALSSSRGRSGPQGAVATRGIARSLTDLEEWKTEESVVVVVEKNALPGKIPDSVSKPNRNCDLESPLKESTLEVNEEGDKEEEGEEWEEWTTEEIVVVKTSPIISNLVANRANNPDHNLNGTPYQRHDARSVPTESTGGVPDSTDTTTAASVSGAEVLGKSGSSKPEVEVDDTPEVNGISTDADSSDEWIVAEEETVDTPEEILALLRRTYSDLSINK